MARKKAEEFDLLVTDRCKFPKKKKIAKINEKKIKTIFSSKVCPFSNSGGYIPTSEDYNYHKVYVIVMEGKR